MEAAFDRMAILLRESNLVQEEQWKAQVRSAGGNRDILEILQQDASLSSFKDLMFAEISLPFGKSRKNPLHEVLSNQIRLSSIEMLEVLRGFQPPLESLVKPMREAGLVSASDAQAVQRRHDPKKPYEHLLRQNVLTPDLLNRYFSQPELRREWPYRYDLLLSLMEANALIPSAEIKNIRDAENVSEAMAELFSREPALGVKALKKARDGLDLPKIDLKTVEIDEDLVQRFPASMIRRWHFLPVSESDGFLRIVFSDPMDLVLGDLLTLLTGRRILAFAAETDSLGAIIGSIFAEEQPGEGEAIESPRTEMAVDRSSTVNLVSSIVEGAIDLKATDIHMEPSEDGGMRVRYRIDGRLRNILRLPPDSVSQVVSRIKVLADLDVTERRRPQDGHFDLQAGDVHFDFRISTLPCHLGEKVVIRVLDESRVGQGLGDLGLLEAQRQSLERMLQCPYGMVLTTGPTGSGKTSTLYACLQTVNCLETNIVTIEDPVEYQLSGVNQVAVNPEIELGFAQGLRAILRQDPDVIMVGEIRDAETAAIAVRAALTGHLVFSTLHTNTALGAFSALSHMGIQPFMSATAIITLVAQRLVRTICPDCRTMGEYDPELARILWPEGDLPENLAQGKGCEACMGSGYRGRTGLYEIVEVGGEVRRKAAEGAIEPVLMDAARERGYTSMSDAAREKVLAGESTLEEVCQQILTLGF